MSVILNNIRAVRTRAGLSQGEVADRLGMSSGNYSKIERGEIALDVLKLEKVAQALGCPLSELVFGPSNGRDTATYSPELEECRKELQNLRQSHHDLQNRYIEALEELNGLRKRGK